MNARPIRSQNELMLSIGGLVGHFEMVDAPAVFMDQVRARYGAFAMPVASIALRDFSLRLAFRSATTLKQGARPPWETNPLTVDVADSDIAIDRWDLSVRVSRGPGRRHRAPYRGEGHCELNPYALDCILRVMWATLLPRMGGLLVHGCGLRHAEVAFVFAGQSGAGKTTLARKAPDADDVLCDELTVLRRLDDGWRVYGTPFWGDFARGGISMRGWPLRTLAFLEHARTDKATVVPITSAEASLRLLGCFVAVATDRATVEQNVALALQLSGEVRSVEASLTKSVPAAEIFRKLSPHLGPEVTRKVPAASAREMISELRAHLRKHGKYASQSKGKNSMRPWLKPGDLLFVKTVDELELVAGDVLLYWSPGATPNDDKLICHRLVGRTARAGAAVPTYITKGDALSHFERFENGQRNEILGKVVAVSRDGQTRPLPGRLGSLARLFGSLAATPLLRMAGR
jgi:hypothetical protein